jgi:hypothetical protein
VGILETIKDAVVLVQKADNIEFMRQLLQVQGEAGSMVEEIYALKARIRELETAKDIAGRLRFGPPYYLLSDEPHPYCVRCWDEFHRLIHLVQPAEGRWDCPSCNVVFSKPEREEGHVMLRGGPRPRR